MKKQRWMQEQRNIKAGNKIVSTLSPQLAAAETLLCNGKFYLLHDEVTAELRSLVNDVKAKLDEAKATVTSGGASECDADGVGEMAHAVKKQVAVLGQMLKALGKHA